MSTTVTIQHRFRPLPFDQTLVTITVTSVTGLPDRHLFLYSPHIINQSLVFQRVVRPEEFNRYPIDDGTAAVTTPAVRKHTLEQTLIALDRTAFLEAIVSEINQLIRRWNGMLSASGESGTMVLTGT